jgi:arabinofuranosyltransferase
MIAAAPPASLDPSGPAGTPVPGNGRRFTAFIVVLCIWLLLLTLIGLKLLGLAADDMYITYRYAHNLLRGEGLTFNPGERVFGISDPGVAMLLAGGAAVTGLAVPEVGTILTAAALLTIAAAVLWEGRKRGRFAEAAAGGTLIVTSSYLWLGQGAGPLVALAVLALAALLAERHPAAAGVVGGLAVWCRPDALIGCGILAALLYREKRRPPVAFASGALLVCGIGIGTARAYFGRFLPSTLAAKQKFAARHLEEYTGLHGFWGRALDIFKWTEGGRGWIVIALGILGLFLFYKNTGLAGRLLLAYGGALALGYTLLRIPFSFWYVGPPAAVIFLGAGFAVFGAARFAARRAGRWSAAVILLVAVVAVGLPLAQARAGWLQQGNAEDWRRAAYQAAGLWLAKNTPPDGDVAFDEVGFVGFYSERPILDLIGLVSPSSIPYTAAGDQVGAFLARPTRYVLLHTHDPRGGTRPIVGRPWFSRSYRQRARIDLPRFGVSMLVFERIPGASVPPPRPPLDKRLAGI